MTARKPSPKRRATPIAAAARKKKPARSAPEKTLSPEWRRWVADNVVRGARSQRIESALRDNGVPARQARACIAEITGSPLLEVIRRDARRNRQLEMLVRMMATSSRTSAYAKSIERRASIPRDEFFERYYATNTPVVITDLVRRWPAFERWNPAYLKSRFGEVDVQMTSGRDGDPDYDINRAKLFVPVKMGDFVDRVLAAGESNDFYLIARNHNTARDELQPLFDDIDWSFDYLDRARARHGSALWFGPAGTITPLHHDTSNILFAQIYGRKRLILASPLETALWNGARAMYAALDPEKPDYTKHPEFRDVVLREVVLEPGDALFIPVGWWHYVRALSVSISTAFNNFARPNPFEWYVPGSA